MTRNDKKGDVWEAAVLFVRIFARRNFLWGESASNITPSHFTYSVLWERAVAECHGKNPACQWFKGGEFFTSFAKNTTRPLIGWRGGTDREMRIVFI